MDKRLDPRQNLIDSITERLRRPDASLSWTGDPDLYCVHNKLLDRWEVHREDGDGKFRMVMAQRNPGDALDASKIIKSLVARDTWLRNNSAERQMEEMFAYNERLENERLDKAAEGLRETMERVYYAAAAHDLKHETGYVRSMTVSSELKTILDSSVVPIPD